MPEPTLEKLKDRLRKSNDDYHEAIDELLSSELVVVVHKAIIGSKAKRIFDLMAEVNSLVDSL